MHRKDFIVSACKGCLVAGGLGSILASCTSTRYVSSHLEKDGLTVNKEEFKINQKGAVAFRSFIIIRNESLKYPICIYRFNETEYAALWMQCSHQGAELQASGDYLHCPAHGSEFNSKGLVTNGPADESLRSFPVTINPTTIFIDLRKQS
ncbi:MAG: Rieske (2Fe-2S) protein [Gemmatimonadaceae bacterium]|nr:Rieske (2Fe-2S) protein [Chitinophagaceae bacterium]